jgi:enoyl-CoA hydratase
MSERAAARYCLTGETFDGAAAAAAGLVTAAVPDVDAEIAALSDALRRSSPQGLAETKALVTAAARARFDAGADAMHRLSQRLFESDEAQEAMRAFLADRRPRWSAER